MTVFKFVAAKRGRRIGGDWQNAFERYYCQGSIPGVIRWDEATAAQIASVKAAASARKFADLIIALKQVPLLDPELVSTIIQKIQVACNVGQKLARGTLNQLIVEEKAFQVPIANPSGARSFSGVTQTRPS